MKAATKWKVGDRCWIARSGTVHHGEIVSVISGILRVDIGELTLPRESQSVHRTRQAARLASARDRVRCAQDEASLQRSRARAAAALSAMADRALAKAKARLTKLRGAS